MAGSNPPEIFTISQPKPIHALNPQISMYSLKDQHNSQYQQSTYLHKACMCLQTLKNAGFSSDSFGVE